MRFFEGANTSLKAPLWVAVAAGIGVGVVSFGKFAAGEQRSPASRDSSSLVIGAGTSARLDFAGWWRNHRDDVGGALSVGAIVREFVAPPQPEQAIVETARASLLPEPVHQHSVVVPVSALGSSPTGPEAIVTAVSDALRGSGRPADLTVAVAIPSKPGVLLEVHRRPMMNARAAFPFDLVSFDKHNGKVVIGGIPDGVVFTKGRQTGQGLWQIKAKDVKRAEFVIEPRAPTAFKLTFMLLDSKNWVTSGVEMAVAVSDSASAERRRAKSVAATDLHPPVEQ